MEAARKDLARATEEGRQAAAAAAQAAVASLAAADERTAVLQTALDGERVAWAGERARLEGQVGVGPSGRPSVASYPGTPMPSSYVHKAAATAAALEAEKGARERDRREADSHWAAERAALAAQQQALALHTLHAQQQQLQAATDSHVEERASLERRLREARCVAKTQVG